MERIELDEEARVLLRQIVERQAYRQLMAVNIRGHGLQYLPSLDDKILFASELDFGLRVLHEVERIHRMLDGEDLYLRVRERMERIPYPGSRLELAVCLAVTERAERVAARSYVDSVCKEFAAVARTLVDASHAASQREEEVFVEYCSDPSNGPRAQEYWGRWLRIALLALGRPGTRGDARAVALRLRSRQCADVLREFVAEIEPLRRSCSLRMPPFDVLGVDLPADLHARFGAS